MDYFEAAIDELRASFPSFWAARTDGSLLAEVLGPVATQVDRVSTALEAVAANARIATADDAALLREHAWLWGVDQETLPCGIGTLRAYLVAMSLDDGSSLAARRVLISLLDTPANRLIQLQATPDLVFPPADPLYFPLSGGLVFGTGGWVTIVESGSHNWEVRVKSTLQFDRPAFARAARRLRPAGENQPTITEV